VGDGGYIDGTGPIEYRIRFENVATASAAAQQVRVTDVLDAKLDWSTLELLEFGFNGAVIVPEQGASGYSGVVYVESDPNPIQCEIHLDPITGELAVDFRSFDEETGDWPADPLAGFLPPNDETGRGDGYIRFSIWPVADLEDGVIIENQASIVFDVNEPIITNVAVNTIDTTAPDAEVAELNERSSQTFMVSWAGDDAGGSGVARYDVYVSVNGGDWTLWLNGTTETSAVYEGEVGSSYGFYAHATDALGFANPVEPTAQAQTIADLYSLVDNVGITNGKFHARFLAPPGISYELQRSLDLSDNSWETIAVGLFPEVGWFWFEESVILIGGRAFYRVVLMP
jgi:hypothetical protein